MLSTPWVRRLYAWHKWLGLGTGLFILFLSVTGAALVFKTELDRALNPDLLVAEPIGEADPAAMLSPDAALARFRAAHPELTLDHLVPPQHATDVYHFNVEPPATGLAFDQVLIDPYTGVLKGRRVYADSAADILRQAHIKLFLDWRGRVAVGLFGLALLASSITGLLIYGRFIKGLLWWKPRHGQGRQLLLSDWHKLVGVLALAFNLVIAVTGTVLGLEELGNVEPAIEQAVQPAPPEAALAQVSPADADLLPIGAALAHIRTALPDFAPTRIEPAVPGERPFYAEGNQGDIAMEGASHAVVDAVTGALLHVHDARAARAVTQAYNWMDPIHFGTFAAGTGFGSALRVLYLLFGLATAGLSITGFWVWYLKVSRRRAATARMAPAGVTLPPMVSG